MKRFAGTLFGLLFAIGVQAQTSYPMLMTLQPIAIQIGTTGELEVQSRYSMWGATRVIISGEGLSGEVVHPEIPVAKEGEKPAEPSLTTLKIKFTATADAAPGVREFKLLTPRGVSTVGQIVVTRDTVVFEDIKSDSSENAVMFEIPATLTGVIEKGEDRDYFKFSIDAPTQLVFHCRCMRLQDRIHDLQKHADPMITVKNSQGSTIAANDNYFAADPFMVVEFQQAGEYYLEVRDVRFTGNKYWNYAIDVLNRPFATNVFPLAISATKPTTFELIGESVPSETTIVYDPATTELPLGPQMLSLVDGQQVFDPVAVYVSNESILFESTADNNDKEHAQEIQIPAVINGRVISDADIDYYQFEAKKGDKISFEIIARRRQSMLDSYIVLENSAGGQLKTADDFQFGRRTYWDSRIENYVVPADGTYYISVYDRHLRGGAEFVYALEITHSQPSFELLLDTAKTLTSPGTGGVVFCRVKRLNGFTGEVQLHVSGMPTGVTSYSGRILTDAVDGCIIFQAAKDAPLGAANVRIYGTAMDDDKDVVEVDALAHQETYMPGGGRNHFPVKAHTVSVQTPSDIQSLKLSTQEITLRPGEAVRIDVEMTRAEGFDKNVSLDVLFKHLSSVWGDTLPKGVKLDGSKSKILITGKETKGHITLIADDKIEMVERQQVSVMANISLNFVMKATYSSLPLFITTVPKEVEPEK
ncbi:MAG: PPC domain-containing protein [Planctomycetota bacterium]|nr:PPC domain-containing protein [Planctomycetota bacterium]